MIRQFLNGEISSIEVINRGNDKFKKETWEARNGMALYNYDILDYAFHMDFLIRITLLS